jgi:hypothetical protein
LTQDGHPIAYFSKGLSDSNKKLSTYKTEFFAVMMVGDKWRSYLHKNPFIIKTDHQSLCYLRDHTLSIELQRKVMRKLSGLEFKFAYKKGCDNKVVDALSRAGFHFSINAITTVVPIWIQEVVSSYHIDSQVVSLLQELPVSSPNGQGYSLSNGVMRYKNKIWVGQNSALQTKLISSFHSSAMGGHSGIQTTYKRL